LTGLTAYVNGTYTGPVDPRLKARSNINGDIDEKVDADDIKLLQDKLGGKISYLPSKVEEATIAEQNDWFTKMSEIYFKTSVDFGKLGGDCNQSVDAYYIQFTGVSEEDKPKYKEVFDKYDFENNGLYNLNALELGVAYHDGLGGDGHLMIAFGNPTAWDKLFIIDPEVHLVNVQLGQYYLRAGNSDLTLMGRPNIGVGTYGTGKKYMAMTRYAEFHAINNVATLYWVNPELQIKK
jgi:hypothetical protein